MPRWVLVQLHDPPHPICIRLGQDLVQCHIPQTYLTHTSYSSIIDLADVTSVYPHAGPASSYRC
jgi:hypothetical protein